VQNIPDCASAAGGKISISRDGLGKLLGKKIVAGGNFSKSRQILHLCGALGAQHLADALRNNTVTLILSSSISYAHLHFFTQTLTTLHLYNNQIGDHLEARLKELIGRNQQRKKS